MATDQYPVMGAKNALLGRLRSVAGRLECHPPARLVPEIDFAASGPLAPALGWSVRQPAEALDYGPRLLR